MSNIDNECSVCRGTGMLPDVSGDDVSCWVCSGTGRYTPLKQAAHDNSYERERHRQDREALDKLLTEYPNGYDARQRMQPYPVDYKSPPFTMPVIPDTLKTSRLPDPPPVEQPAAEATSDEQSGR